MHTGKVLQDVVDESVMVSPSIASRCSKLSKTKSSDCAESKASNCADVLLSPPGSCSLRPQWLMATRCCARWRPAAQRLRHWRNAPQAMRHVQRQTCLANASGPHQCDQPMTFIQQQLLELRRFWLSPHQKRGGQRQARRSGRAVRMLRPRQVGWGGYPHSLRLH